MSGAVTFLIILSVPPVVVAQRCTSIAFQGYDKCGLYCRISLAAGASYRLPEGSLDNISTGLSETDAVTTFGYDADDHRGGAATDAKVPLKLDH